MRFLFESVGYPYSSHESVIALQSIDTLNTIVSDSDLAPRLEPMLPQIVEILNQMTPVIKYPAYFEFLSEFVKFYAVVLKQFILPILSTVINRILAEQNILAADPSDKSPSVIINKSWNVIRLICDRPEYMPALNNEIEEMLKQLFVFMIEPTNINFEDDIVMNVKQFIRRNKCVSVTQWEIFNQFPKVLAKNKDSFGNLLDTINYYLIYGKDDLQTSQRHLIKVVAQMAETALFTTKQNVKINNTEGAILIQMLLQTMRGTDACNEIILPLLSRVRDRMSIQPQSDLLKKHLLCVYLSAVLYNRSAAMLYFEQ